MPSNASLTGHGTTSVTPRDGPDGLGGVVEAGRLVEVAGQQHRVALVEPVRPSAGSWISSEEARTSFSEATTSSTGTPRASELGTVGDVVEMGVEDATAYPRLDLDEGVEAVGPGRLEDRELREQLQAHVVVGVAGPSGDCGEPVVGLQHPDDVGVERGDDLVGRGFAAVLDVVDEHIELHGCPGRRRPRLGTVHQRGSTHARLALRRITAAPCQRRQGGDDDRGQGQGPGPTRWTHGASLVQPRAARQPVDDAFRDVPRQLQRNRYLEVRCGRDSASPIVLPPSTHGPSPRAPATESSERVSVATAVRLERVAKHFGAVDAVDGVDLEIADGEFFSMLGPSGSGKTTVLRMIAGFEMPTAGTVALGGRDVTAPAPFERDVNTVFQDYALFPHMNVLDERRVRPARCARSARSERRDGPLAALAPSGSKGSATAARRSCPAASGSASRWPARWSTGPRCCCSTSRSARSTSSCASEMQVELKQIQREVGITFVFVTHDQEEALTMSDRIAVFDAGPDRAGRHPGRGLRGTRPRRSWPASSAPPTCCTGDAARAVIGRDGTFSIRPEKIHLAGRDRADASRRARGVVASVVYRGLGHPLRRRPRRRRPADRARSRTCTAPPTRRCAERGAAASTWPGADEHVIDLIPDQAHDTPPGCRRHHAERTA